MPSLNDRVWPVPHRVITLGARGAGYTGHDAEFTVAAPVVEALDTSGAGDVFAGVLAAGWTAGRQYALRRACAAGALATLTPGAGDCAPYADATDVVGYGQAATAVQFVVGLVDQYATVVGREQDRHVVMRHGGHERQPVDPQQRRPDRGAEQMRVTRTGDLRGDLVLHPVDDQAGGLRVSCSTTSIEVWNCVCRRPSMYDPTGGAASERTGCRTNDPTQCYAGPRPIPGHGPHRYRFQLFALDEVVPESVTKPKALLQRMAGHVLARGVLTGTYER